MKLCVSPNPMRSTDALDYRNSADFGSKHTIYIHMYGSKNTRHP